MPYASGKDFLTAYQAATKQQPDTFAAETYDSVGLVVAGIKKSNSTSASGINTGMTQVAASGGLTGAIADPMTFKDRSAVSSGQIIEWENGKETLAPGQ